MRSDPLVDDVPADWRDSEQLPVRPTEGGWIVMGEREATIVSDTVVEVRP